MALITGSDLASTLGLTYADDEDTFDQVADAADETVSSLLTPRDHSGHARCVEAATAVAVEIFQSRTAAGGQPVAVDFTGSSYRLSVWLTRRVASLTAGCQDVAGMVG